MYSMERGHKMQSFGSDVNNKKIEFIVEIDKDIENINKQKSIHNTEADLIQYNIKNSFQNNNNIFLAHDNYQTNLQSIKTDITVNLQINTENIGVQDNVSEVGIEPNICEVILDEVDQRIIKTHVETSEQKQESVITSPAMNNELQSLDTTEPSAAGDLLFPNILTTYPEWNPMNECLNQFGFSPNRTCVTKNDKSTNNMVEFVSLNKSKRKLKIHTFKANKHTKKVKIERNIYTYETKNCAGNSDQNNLKPELSCNKCCYKTQDIAYMNLHVLQHENKDDIFPCTICDFVTIKNELLTDHLIEHNGRTPFKCFLCDFKGDAPSVLIKHANTYHPEIVKPFSCNVCKYKSAHNSDIIRHTRTHTGEKPFSCKQCSYRCTDISSLGFHMRTHTGEKPYSCKLCDYRSKCNSALVSHMRRHTGERPYTCKSCNFKFANNSDLVRHTKINTGDNFSCNVCEFSSTAKCALIKHLRTHEVNFYTCVLCNFECSRHCYLLKHMRTHNGKDVYKCNDCEYTCDTYTRYTKHTIMHTIEMSFSCNICNYMCIGRRNLTRHMRNHNVEKNYACSQCDFKCYRKSNLVVHERCHVDEKPFLCAHCEYTCHSSRTLLRHVQKIHAGKSEVEFII